MPGVPAELISIFEMHVVPMLQNLHSHYYNTGFMFEGVGESTIATELKNLRNDYPEIWIKTHPQKTREKPFRVELHLTAFLESDDEQENDKIKSRMDELKDKIRKIIENHDGVIKNP
jgi:molybdopterin-biosynthesis enzyme MoeA-like protein